MPLFALILPSFSVSSACPKRASTCGAKRPMQRQVTITVSQASSRVKVAIQMRGRDKDRVNRPENDKSTTFQTLSLVKSKTPKPATHPRKDQAIQAVVSGLSVPVDMLIRKAANKKSTADAEAR